MISTEQKDYISRNAYVPEHVVDLMVGISQGEPFWADGHLFFVKEDWLIFIGYPFERVFQPEFLTQALKGTLEEFRPAHTWLIAPEIPESLFPLARCKETDEYYKLDLQDYILKKNLGRIIEKAAGSLGIERSREFTSEHKKLTEQFLHREIPNPRVRELYLRMPEYVAYSRTSRILSAWSPSRALSAFYVVELGAEAFAAYVVGCFSRDPYIPHASDLLFHEMILLAKENSKTYIHLGLGVNEGIKRFKKKWGGVPSLKYESAEISPKPRGPLAWIQALQGRW